MEHAEALERIEIAAAEPEGLDRLMAGDTADAAAVAGHLAGCPSCTAELVADPADGGRRARRHQRRAGPGAPRADARLRQGRGSRPDATGAAGSRPRTAALPPSITVLPAPAGSAAGASPADASPAASTRRPARRGRRAARGRAAVVIAVGIGYVGRRVAAKQTRPRRQRPARSRSSSDATADRRRASTRSPTRSGCARRRRPRGGDAAGTLVFSPTTGELVAVATGLEPEAEQRGVRVLGRGRRHAPPARPHVLGGRRVDLGRTGRGPRRPAAAVPPSACRSAARRRRGRRRS